MSKKPDILDYHPKHHDEFMREVRESDSGAAQGFVLGFVSAIPSFFIRTRRSEPRLCFG